MFLEIPYIFISFLINLLIILTFLKFLCKKKKNRQVALVASAS
jgi:hypothetical protein